MRIHLFDVRLPVKLYHIHVGIFVIWECCVSIKDEE